MSCASSRYATSRKQSDSSQSLPLTPSNTKMPVWLIVTVLGMVVAVIMLAIYGVKKQYSLASRAIATKNPWIVGETMLTPALLQKL